VLADVPSTVVAGTILPHNAGGMIIRDFRREEASAASRTKDQR